MILCLIAIPLVAVPFYFPDPSAIGVRAPDAPHEIRIRGADHLSIPNLVPAK